MKKMTLVAASVALALTGCGNDDNKSAQLSTTQITAFDGYFHNAVVFNDTNENGILDVGVDTIFGLTDIKGQISIPAGQTGFLALQTLTPGGVVQSALENAKPETYKDIYTIDSDHPGQSVAHELVLRSPATADVISPITDLVAIEMAKSTANVPITEAEAIAKVSQNLGLGDSSSVTVYSDFVAVSATNDEAAKLHKTAQILTVTKGGNSKADYEQKSEKITNEAVEAVDKIIADGGDIRDPDLKPVIDPDGMKDPVTNYVVTVDKEKSDSILSILNEAPYQVGNALDLGINVDGLFKDADQIGDIIVSLPLESTNALEGMGIEANFSSDFKLLTLTSTELMLAGTVALTLQAQDLDSSNPAETVGNPISMTYNFIVNPVTPNAKPTYDNAILESINTETKAWVINEDQAFSQTFSIAGLFSDAENNPITYEFNFRQFTNLTAVRSGDTVTVSGTPESDLQGQENAIYIYAWDDQHVKNDAGAAKVEVKLPVITPSPKHKLEDKNLYFVEFETDGRSYPEGNITCSTLLLDNGFAYISENEDNLKGCQTANIRGKLGNYDINDQGVITIHESGDYTDDGKYYDITMEVLDTFENDNGKTYRVKSADKEVGSSDESYVGAMEIFTSVDDVQYFSKSDAVCEQGDDTCGGRYKKHISPSVKTNDKFILRTVGYQLEQKVSESGVITLDANIYFDSTDPEEVLTCDQLTDMYGAQFFLIYSQGENRVTKIINDNGSDPSTYCFTSRDDADVAEGVSIDFDITLEQELTVGSIVSFASLPSDSYDEAMNELGINMEWTGQGNND